MSPLDPADAPAVYGFLIERILEPRPGPDARDAPDDERLTTSPVFICFRLLRP